MTKDGAGGEQVRLASLAPVLAFFHGSWC